MEFIGWIIALVVIVAVVAGAWGLYKTFRPEIERAKRIRRANRHGIDK